MTTLHLTASSQADEAGFLALRDLAAVADDLGIEYRIVGGQMVRLHVALAAVPEPVARVTLDADMGITAASARNQVWSPDWKRSATPGRKRRTASSVRRTTS